MSDNIPFELQSEIMKRLPAESLIRFRSVCKSWKSLIHSSDFIAGYRGQQHLIVRFEHGTRRRLELLEDSV
ncbi:putative F-box domain-containing protein [Helianthus annuus]|uniref:F-box domain-containing protein n=1 Tax=Helianthus annuus TaxID=4232 RepID=A0A9K3H3R0_HELAN|nr:putative F-box domain-containing protein [Helianthus annuus]KAJ0831709.1 putative F-box domain-containing protein [Helianthus annuus]